MATAYVRLGGVMGGAAPVYQKNPTTQDITPSGTSQATTISASSGQYARIVASGADLRVAIGPAPVAVANAGDIVLDGTAIDIGPLSQADKVAIITSA